MVVVLNYNGFEYIQRANTARQVSELSRQKEEALRAAEREKQERAKREERIAAGAEASIAQVGILEKQVEYAHKQNEMLEEELGRSRRYNRVMMIITIISTFAAIASPIVAILVSR